ncbi:MAG TPA: membrane protein insertion efficiency factor YidD [Opitutae bacterium]|nr:membrane protein insertion efficiency factor YidD [Opitutae bacterium]
MLQTCARATCRVFLLLYKYTLSPAIQLFFGADVRCKFHPSCSSYAHECYRKHGILQGTYLSIRRLLRCNPFHEGGNDPVP